MWVNNLIFTNLKCCYKSTSHSISIIRMTKGAYNFFFRFECWDIHRVHFNKKNLLTFTAFLDILFRIIYGRENVNLVAFPVFYSPIQGRG